MGGCKRADDQEEDRPEGCLRFRTALQKEERKATVADEERRRLLQAVPTALPTYVPAMPTPASWLPDTIAPTPAPTKYTGSLTVDFEVYWEAKARAGLQGPAATDAARLALRVQTK